MHSQPGALNELRRLAHEVEALVDSLPRDTAMDAELKLALQGIGNAGSDNYLCPTPRANQKPRLNVEDL